MRFAKLFRMMRWFNYYNDFMHTTTPTHGIVLEPGKSACTCVILLFGRIKSLLFMEIFYFYRQHSYCQTRHGSLWKIYESIQWNTLLDAFSQILPHPTSTPTPPLPLLTFLFANTFIETNIFYYATESFPHDKFIIMFARTRTSLFYSVCVCVPVLVLMMSESWQWQGEIE